MVEATDSREAERRGRKAIAEQASRLERLSIEYVDIDSIHANDYNPNRQSDHDFELLLKSMRMDGFTQPILVLRKSRAIVDGEHRWRGAKTLNEEAEKAGLPAPYPQIPVVLVDMDPAQAKLSTLRHNRARGSEDIEMVAEMLRDFEKLGAIDFAKDELMMDKVEIDRLLADIAAPDAMAAEEFSTAWVPQGTHHAAEDQQGDAGRTIGGARAIEGITEDAAGKQRQMETAIRAAKTEEERQAVMKDNDIYRVALSFTGDQATIVKQSLGDRPADKLLELCRKDLGMT